MHCLACNVVLSDAEATRKVKGEFLDLCNNCNSDIKKDLNPPDEEVDNNDDWDDPNDLDWDD